MHVLGMVFNVVNDHRVSFQALIDLFDWGDYPSRMIRLAVRLVV